MLFLGLDNAGKTTLLGTLASGRIKSCKPTIRPNCEELALGNITFNTYDLGGHSSARTLWTEYSVGVDVIVFMVDATDKERIHESRDELGYLLSMNQLSKVPVLVLGNKIDLREAMSELELRYYMNLQPHLTTGKEIRKLAAGVRPIEVFMCSVVTRSGYTDGFRWVAQFLK